jgi:hypothetical protein
MAAGSCLHTPLPDSDGDEVCDVADNCPQYANPGGQAPLVFGQTIVAVSPLEFCWLDPADVGVWEGPLVGVSGYVGALTQSLAGVVCFAHSSPDSGYYLVSLDCHAGSWQSSLGVEPERDVSLGAP